jgi:hypothetical protein
MSNSMTTPNLYELHGNDLSVVYSTSGFDGQPSFAYQDEYVALSRRGDEIRTNDTEVGTLVTITIQNTPDLGSTSFTLLVPRVNLSGTQRGANISTEGITTRHRSSIAPQLDQGQIDHYRVTHLSGTADFVQF